MVRAKQRLCIAKGLHADIEAGKAGYSPAMNTKDSLHRKGGTRTVSIRRSVVDRMFGLEKLHKQATSGEISL